MFIVAQLLLRLPGGKSSAATKTHFGEQKSSSKGQQALGLLFQFTFYDWVVIPNLLFIKRAH
ncbi:hypothetical protein [Pseudoalteromonas piscicida]|uniref:Uncharacterized protein n=1 Tax=Pseudoalteromonas piscicida TaxID=43662 RepID=A0AAD0W3F2_PSEO7|nr:hypothetical protein [Pseudoalteromonas piscicida]ASD67270.1 hypothetical protein B1L02_09675 [Pseudoalteromonas piscicida]AXR02029.1 hypothetical protein D0511_08090 [Pseudoalteromonas piscicida]